MFSNKVGCQLSITGIRKEEGGVRATTYKNCFTPSITSSKHYDEYRPLFWITDKDKEEYEQYCDIIHSDCYTRYGLKRTGCVGCPYNSNFEEELNVVRTYEPKFSKAVENIFGDAYEYTRKYKKYKILNSKKGNNVQN